MIVKRFKELIKPTLAVIGKVFWKQKNRKLMKTFMTFIVFFVATMSTYSQDRPNVIFVMPDDISHNAFSYYKENGPKTPNIDKLADESLRLTDFHVSPSCSPTRGGSFDWQT